MTDIPLQQKIAEYIDPYLGVSLGEAEVVREVSGENVVLELGFPTARYADALVEALRAHTGMPGLKLEVRNEMRPRATQRGVDPIPGVKNTLAIASGKGGVGKSTTTVNLALALADEGARVGILDADIYGPSQPRMLGTLGKPETLDGKSIQPLTGHGIQCMSIGNLVDEETPMIWRGPMATGALEQLLRDTRWDNLDYLLIDLPPGTGDIQLTLCQKIPLTAALIVTTPQDIALLDARRGLKMFEKVKVPVLGVVENMSVHVCSACGHAEHIFGEGGGARMAADHKVALLGSLPLDISVREGTDNGRPSVIGDPEGVASNAYREIARRASAQMSLLARNMSAGFPRIVVENS